MRRLLIAILILLMAPVALAEEQKIAKGKLTDPVRSTYDPKQTHALYVPSHYAPDKKWPLLLCFDARAQGKIPVELFREGAERLGWIIVSSNHTSSDGESGAQNLQALK